MDIDQDQEIQISTIAKQVCDVSIEIDALTAQVQPVLDRIKDLKKQKKDLKNLLAPVMEAQSVEKVSTTAVQICLRANAQKMKPFNHETVKLALDEYRVTKEPNLMVDEIVNFIDDYRKSHKDRAPAVSFRKTKDYVPLPVTAVQPVKVGAPSSTRFAPPPSNVVLPFAI